MDERGHFAAVRYGRGSKDDGPMTTLLLFRHGLCDPVGRSIAGRSPGVHLNSSGRRQASALAEVLSPLPVIAVYSSPQERARETAEPAAERLGLPVRVAAELAELDYGDWTGRTLASLADDAEWQRFNRERGSTRIPGGETMAEIVTRAAGAVSEIRARHPDAIVAAFTHGDVIRALLASWAGMPLDHMLRLEVAPGSTTAVRLSPEPQLLMLNWLADLSAAL
jgi:probable phosphoglycerate mutase